MLASPNGETVTEMLPTRLPTGGGSFVRLLVASPVGRRYVAYVPYWGCCKERLPQKGISSFVGGIPTGSTGMIAFPNGETVTEMLSTRLLPAVGVSFSCLLLPLWGGDKSRTSLLGSCKGRFPRRGRGFFRLQETPSRSTGILALPNGETVTEMLPMSLLPVVGVSFNCCCFSWKSEISMFLSVAVKGGFTEVTPSFVGGTPYYEYK